MRTTQQKTIPDLLCKLYECDEKLKADFADELKRKTGIWLRGRAKEAEANGTNTGLAIADEYKRLYQQATIPDKKNRKVRWQDVDIPRPGKVKPHLRLDFINAISDAESMVRASRLELGLMDDTSRALRDAICWLSGKIKSRHDESYFKIYCHEFTEKRRLAQMTMKDRYKEDDHLTPIITALIGPKRSEKWQNYKDFENELEALDTPENFAELKNNLNDMWPEEMEEIEGLPENDVSPDCEASIDFTFVRWYGTDYKFNKTQAMCIRLLWLEWEKGRFGLSDMTIREEIGSENNRYRLAHTFRTKDIPHPAWGTMIQSDGKGIYQLVVPDNHQKK